ncbi:MAG: hypothetical protein AB7O47_09940 [Flavobacteriales bacterium]
MFKVVGDTFIRFFFVLSIFTQSHSLISQTTKCFEDDIKKSFRVSPQLDAKFDFRFSFIASRDFRTSGFKIGISFNKKFKMGLGYNQLLVPAKSIVNDNNKSYNAELKYINISPYFEYVYYTSKRWEFNLSAQVGIGRGHYQYYNNDAGKTIRAKYSTILSYEPVMLIDYKIIPWFGVGTGVGYRLIFYKNSNIEEHLTSPVYVFKIKVYLGEIVRTITGKEIQAE